MRDSGERVARAAEGVVRGDVERMNESLDVFISYRRETGADAAMALYYALKEKGYKVFIDVHSLGEGTFDDKLLQHIENARNVLIVLTAGCLDRCASREDWLRKEIEHAFDKGCIIIPVIKPDFNFPPIASLPIKMRALPRHSGISYSHDLFDGTLARICRFLEQPDKIDFSRDLVQGSQFGLRKTKDIGTAALQKEFTTKKPERRKTEIAERQAIKKTVQERCAELELDDSVVEAILNASK